MKRLCYIKHEGIIHIGVDTKHPNPFWSYGDGTKKCCDTKIIGAYEHGLLSLDRIFSSRELCQDCNKSWNDVDFLIECEPTPVFELWRGDKHLVDFSTEELKEMINKDTDLPMELVTHGYHQQVPFIGRHIVFETLAETIEGIKTEIANREQAKS